MQYRTLIIASFACMASASAAQAQAQAQAQNVASTSPINSSYKLVFDDEFNGSAIDTTKWNVMSNSWIGGGYGLNQFTPKNATIASGSLKLAVTKGSPSGRPYSAAFISTKQSFRYGYFEERAMMPANGHGMWPAFWMNNNGAYPEIDVFEWLGNNPVQQWSTLHPVNDVALTGGVGLGTTVSGSNFSTAYHVYGMLWTPTSIAWFIDGVRTLQLTQGENYRGVVVNIPSTSMQTILNSAVGGWNNNSVDSSTTFPSTYRVDYIHVYSNTSTAATVSPQSNYSEPSDIFGSISMSALTP